MTESFCARSWVRGQDHIRLKGQEDNKVMPNYSEESLKYPWRGEVVDGYYYLGHGDIIQTTDELLSSITAIWTSAGDYNMHLGKPWKSGLVPFRRKASTHYLHTAPSQEEIKQLIKILELDTHTSIAETCPSCDKPIQYTDATWQAGDELSKPYPPPGSPSIEFCIKYKDRYYNGNLIGKDSVYCFNPPHDWRGEALRLRALVKE